MFDKILYPTDFSEIAHKALPYIEALKSAGANEVIILHVNDETCVNTLRIFTAQDVLALEKRLKDSALNQIAPLEDELRSKGFRVKSHIDNGIPFREILKVAEEENVSIIIMGSHGKNSIIEIMLGSVAEKVASRAHKPVLIVRR
ncbi:MAG: universal stress protein [Desulfomonilia bacterium]|jgi:nucleotide-binding universal stress UspA family protein